MQFYRLPNCFTKTRSFANDRNIFPIGQQRPNSSTHYVRVICQKHPDAHHAPFELESYD
jgi:hypothetical protein